MHLYESTHTHTHTHTHTYTHTHTHTHTQANKHTDLYAYVCACTQVEALREENEALRVQNSMLWALQSPAERMCQSVEGSNAAEDADEDAADGSLDPPGGGDCQGEAGGEGLK